MVRDVLVPSRTVVDGRQRPDEGESKQNSALREDDDVHKQHWQYRISTARQFASPPHQLMLRLCDASVATNGHDDGIGPAAR
ncbi:hypothetical protein [Mesorhizobium shangrilense]|uniref:Uncharacterized protein n=1 Tax=Mesorhizobium shangrilense TaxID=460060 RepID=A0ABV2DLS8_9HYPH